MNLKITLKWSYLKNEIDYETYKAAEISITGDSEAKGEAKSDNTNADADFCRTKIDAAVGNLGEIMHRYFLASQVESTDNTLTRDKTSWEINLFYADSGRRAINMDALTNKCSRYVVAYVLAEWCKLTLPNLVSYYQGRLDSEEKGIEILVNRKQSPTLYDDEETPTIVTVDGIVATAAVNHVATIAESKAEVKISKTTTASGTEVPSFDFTFYLPGEEQNDINFATLQDVVGVSGGTAGKVWGITSVVDNVPQYGWLDNYHYTADEEYITINSSNKISLATAKFGSLAWKSNVDISSVNNLQTKIDELEARIKALEDA